MRHLQNAVLWIGTMNENGMEWNGMEWNGMEWNGPEWTGMESNHFYYAVVVSVVIFT